jgi:hypothetical protein
MSRNIRGLKTFVILILGKNDTKIRKLRLSTFRIAYNTDTNTTTTIHDDGIDYDDNNEGRPTGCRLGISISISLWLLFAPRVFFFKGRFSGFIRHWGFCASLLYPCPYELPSFTTRGAVYQPDTQKKGTNGIWPAILQFSKRAGFFYMPQSWNMGQIILLPLRRKACCGFFPRTRDLGYQRAAC